MKKKLALITLTAGVLLAVVFLASHLHHKTEEKVLSQFNERQLLIARQTARQIESYFHSRSQDIRYLSSFTSLQHLDVKKMRTDVQANFNRLKTVHIKEILVLDAKGKIVYSTGGDAIGSRHGRSDMYAWARKPANKGMVRLAIERTDEQGAPPTGGGVKPPSSRISLVTPLYQESVADGSPGPGGKFFGIILLTIDLEKMLAERTLLFEPTKKSHTLWIWMMDEDGTLLLQSEHPSMAMKNIREKRGECNRCHVSFDYAEKIATAKQGTVEYQLKGRQKKIAAFAPMTFENTSWIVVLNSPFDEVAGFIRGNFRNTLGLIGIVVVAVGLASFSMYRTYRQKVSAQEEVKHLREKQELMEALQKSEERYRMIVETTHDIIWTLDTQGKFTFVNRRGEELSGYRADELIGKNFVPLVHDEDFAKIQKIFMETLSGRPHFYDVRVNDKNGKCSILSVDTVPIFENNNIVGTLSSGRDITERKRTEEEIRSSEERFRILFDSAMDGILLVDMENRQFKMGNRTICTMLGYGREEIPHLGVTNIHPVENLPHVIDMFERQARGELVVSTEIPMRRKDGSIFHADIASTQITFGERRYMVGYFRDVTRERTLRKQVQTAQKMESVGTLAGGIAHDFNNVLTVIIGYGEMLKPRISHDPKAISDLDEVLRSAERASVLTRQLLTFARRQVIDPTNLDLNEVMTGLVKLLRKVTREDIEIKTFLAEGVPTIRADQGQVEQVLMNLSLNARDAMPGGGQLVVETQDTWVDEEYMKQYPYMKAGRYAVLLVSDTGIGMDEETRERIFEPFFTTKGPDKGTGLGLAMVYGIVKQHNGFIHVYSAPGKGTTFRIYFPAVDVPADSKVVAARGVIRGGSETILLAEDDESIRNLTEQTLISYGYKVLIAYDGEGAVDIFRRHGKEIAIAVLDVVMPKMGGKQAYDEMATTIPGLKVLFLSGYSADAIHDSFVLHPGIPFLQKPFGPGTLARKVREVLDRE